MGEKFFKLILYASIVFSISYTGAKYFTSKLSIDLFNKGLKCYKEDNIKNSLDYFKSSCFGRNVLGCFNAGILSSRLKKYNDSYDYFLRGCGFKNAKSCYEAGNILINFIKHHNEIRAKKTAQRLFKLGCDLGEDDACSMLNEVKLSVRENPH